MSSKEIILKRISEVKQTRHNESVFSVSNNTDIYKPVLPDAVTCFKNELDSISGKCEVFESEKDAFVFLKNKLQEKEISNIFCREKGIQKLLNDNKISFLNAEKDFESMEAAIIGCDFLVARTGSLIVTSESESGRQLISFPPTLYVLACKNQLVDYLEDAYLKLQEKYQNNFPSQITTITGPSRTADIEKTLVLGAHGPKEFTVLLCK